jgi:hypothetical protein
MQQQPCWHNYIAVFESGSLQRASMGFEVHNTEPASVCKGWEWTASQGVER